MALEDDLEQLLSVAELDRNGQRARSRPRIGRARLVQQDALLMGNLGPVVDAGDEVPDRAVKPLGLLDVGRLGLVSEADMPGERRRADRARRSTVGLFDQLWVIIGIVQPREPHWTSPRTILCNSE